MSFHYHKIFCPCRPWRKKADLIRDVDGGIGNEDNVAGFEPLLTEVFIVNAEEIRLLDAVFAQGLDGEKGGFVAVPGSGVIGAGIPRWKWRGGWRGNDDQVVAEDGRDNSFEELGVRGWSVKVGRGDLRKGRSQEHPEVGENGGRSARGFTRRSTKLEGEP